MALVEYKEGPQRYSETAHEWPVLSLSCLFLILPKSLDIPTSIMRR